MARLIRASEIGEYLYCARAWWLRSVAGLDPVAGRKRRESGVVAHRRHAAALHRSTRLLGVALLLLIAAALLLAWSQ